MDDIVEKVQGESDGLTLGVGGENDNEDAGEEHVEDMLYSGSIDG